MTTATTPAITVSQAVESSWLSSVCYVNAAGQEFVVFATKGGEAFTYPGTIAEFTRLVFRAGQGESIGKIHNAHFRHARKADCKVVPKRAWMH